MTTQTEVLKIVATGLPATIEDYQLALNAAFAGGKALGEALAQQSNEQVEPVAWQDKAKLDELVSAEDWDDISPEWHWMYRPLFAHPPAPKDEQVESMASRKEFEQWCALSGHDYCFDLNEMGAYQWADAQGAYEAYWARPAFPHPPVPYVVEPRTAQPEQESTNLERHKRNVHKFLGTPQPKEPDQEPVAIQYASKAERDLYEMEDEDDITQPQRYPLTDAQADSIINGLRTCLHLDSKRVFVKTWLRDWAAHGIKE